ncbi:MAG: copper homeostasis protein CutC, partial [Fulvivirga sp.]
MGYQIEICANSVQSVINAERAGAHRVELCDNLWEGGTTPSAASIKLAKAKTNIPVYVLIRPRGGDFVYSDLEFEIIKEDIRVCKELGVEGIVSGVLN